MPKKQTKPEFKFFDEPPAQSFPGRTPLPRPWVKAIKQRPRKWALIETHEDAKKAAPRANAHRLWAKQHKLPIEIISRTVPENWQSPDSELDPSETRIGIIMARWSPGVKG